MIVTIDGPSGSGKTSVAAAVAKELGFHHFSTSLLYRGAAWILIDQWKKNNESEHWEGLTEAEYQLILLLEYRINADLIGEIWFKNQNITPFLKSELIAAGASKVSADQSIREILLDVQRAVADRYSLVADGRDCGSVVFPDAEVKIFLTASLDARAQRAWSDPGRKDASRSLESLLKSLKERDERDSNRPVAPLRVPEGALVIDATDISFEQVVSQILLQIKIKSSIK